MNANAPYNTGALKNMVNKVKAYCAHIIPLVFDNTLSYYESLCACVAKINQCCDAINAQNLTIVEFTHMVEVEITKLTDYVNQAITDLQARLDEDEARITAAEGRLDTAEGNITLLTARVDRHAQRLEGIDNTLNEYHTRIVANENNITTLQETMTEVQSDISSLQTLLGELQTYVNTYFVKKADVTNTVQQGNNNPISSGAVYNAFQNIGDNLPDASYVGKGVVMVDGTSPDHALTLTNGVLGVNNASSALKGVVKIGDNINVSNGGIISVPEANAVTKGVVTIDSLDSNLTLNNGVLDVPTGTKSNKGVLQVGTNLTVSSGVVDVPRADDLGGAYGVVAPKVGGAITATDGEIDVKDATTTTKGAVRLTDTIQSGDTSHVPTSDAVYNAVTGLVPPQVADATTTSKGIVQIGDNIDVNSGVISVADGTTLVKGVVQKTAYIRDNDMNVPTSKAVYDAITGMTIADATTTSKGIVQIGDNIDVSNGEISVPTADATTKGVVTVDALAGNLTLNNGVLDVPTGSTSQKGVLQVGSNLTVSSGVVDVPTADATTKGVVTVDALTGNLRLNNGVLDVPTGNTTTKGVLQVGGNLTVSGGIVDVPVADSTTKGVVTVDALSGNLTLTNGVLDVPTGSTSQKGVLQVGSNLEVSSGVVNVPKATQSSRGVVVPALSGAITATNDGEIDVQTATTSAKGVVTLANSVTSGDTTHVPTADAVYNAIAGAGVADATTTSKGIIQVGSNLEVASGVLSVPDATTSTKGVLKYGNNFNINGNGQLAVNTGANVTTDANGAITVPTADAINKGVVSIGNNIDINNGAISVADATTLAKGVVQKTAYVRDNDYNVPTSKAVYDEIQSATSGGVGRLLFPDGKDEWTVNSDCFLASSNAGIITSNAIIPSTYLTIGNKGFYSGASPNYYQFLWVKNSLIGNKSIELEAKSNIIIGFNSYYSTTPFISHVNFADINNVSYLVLKLENVNDNSALISILI